ncbi:MAG: PAS domain-containing protein [Planctomycetota bacterium]
MATKPQPTGRERVFPEDELIVSKTDAAGVITYANDLFLEISRYTEEELIGAPHSLLRHPDMPRAVFGLLWDEIQAAREVFAYVKNLASDGDHYWVLAHVTPSFDGSGRVTGFHSSRRTTDPAALAAVEPLYAAMVRAERAAGPGPAAVEAGRAVLDQQLAEAGCSYEQFVFSLVA